MNESDADYLTQGMTAAGFSAVAELEQADIAILVTCSVRQNAEQKAYGRFRELKAWKRARPGRAIAMTGCMANKEKDRLYERLPDLDYRFDMRQYEAFIRDLQGEYETDPAQTGGAILQHGLTAYVPAIFGCNEVCSFCIVPFVRGIERSRPLEDVVEDVRRFARQGVREVTLLGQTINSYRDPAGGARLADLLEAVERVPGIWRVRFLTSHPRHVHDDLLFAWGIALMSRSENYFAAGTHPVATAGWGAVSLPGVATQDALAFDLERHRQEVLHGKASQQKSYLTM